MSSRGLTIALLVSAAVNVFLIGAGAGLVASGAFSGGGPAAPAPNPLRAAADRLDGPDRDALLELLQDQVQASGPVMLDARLARREARRLMLTQPFDAGATAAALARARADDIAVRARLETAVVAFAGKLSPSERAALSSGVMRAPQPAPRPGLLSRLGLAPARP